MLRAAKLSCGGKTRRKQGSYSSVLLHHLHKEDSKEPRCCGFSSGHDLTAWHQVFHHDNHGTKQWPINLHSGGCGFGLDITIRWHSRTARGSTNELVSVPIAHSLEEMLSN